MGIVEHHLRRSRTHVAQLLYALAFRARTDVPGRVGFADARAFHDWLIDPEGGRYAHDDCRELEPQWVVQARTWWPPSSRAPQPERVLKDYRFTGLRGEDDQGPPDDQGAPERLPPESTDFSREKLVRSFERTLNGRTFDGVLSAPDREGRGLAEQRKQVARLAADWVLWGLAGQETVRSWQLRDAVLRCLRRIDDIAYLRYCALAKSYRRETDLHNEAAGLVRYPSPRLLFVSPRDVALHPDDDLPRSGGS